MIRGLVRTILAASAALVLSAAPTYAGNIALTGHDDDLHCNGFVPQLSCTQLGEMVAFARSGASDPTLPVLSFGGEFGDDLTSSLTALGIPFTDVDTVAGVGTAAFDPTLFSAFVVASHETCGGCDVSNAFVDAVAARSADIITFFNAGGGVVGLAGAEYAASYYNFLPQSASGFGSPPSTGYVATGPCFGTPITAVNGDPSHNFFPEPGASGVSSLYCVAERNTLVTGNPAMTLLLQGGTIVTDIITTTTGTTTGTTTDGVPEPVALTLLGLGAIGATLRHRRRIQEITGVR